MSVLNSVGFDLITWIRSGLGKGLDLTWCAFFSIGEMHDWGPELPFLGCRILVPVGRALVGANVGPLQSFSRLGSRGIRRVAEEVRVAHHPVHKLEQTREHNLVYNLVSTSRLAGKLCILGCFPELPVPGLCFRGRF